MKTNSVPPTNCKRCRALITSFNQRILKGTGSISSVCLSCYKAARKIYHQQFYSNEENLRKKKEQERRKYREDPDRTQKRLEYTRKWKEQHPNYRSERKLEVYGLSLETFNKMIEDQGGVCCICNRLPGKRGFNVDHNHKTGEVRGLLCHLCNTAIGLLREDLTIFQSAERYLIKHSIHKNEPQDPQGTLAPSAYG